MCNPIMPLVSHRILERRWLVFPAVETVTEHARAETAAAAAAAAAAVGGGGNGGSMKGCVCSPTNHPGSFRCRHHHADYAWGRRITKKVTILTDNRLVDSIDVHLT